MIDSPDFWDNAQWQSTRQRLLAHPLYTQLTDIARLRVFMEHHVWAVWDFMSLLKRLQHMLTGLDIPWLPPANRSLARFINEIVLGEESDEDGEGGYASHFELYWEAMRQCGADTGPIDAFLSQIRSGQDPLKALDLTAPPSGVQQFVRTNLTLAQRGRPHQVAAAFFYGREDIIPAMFRQMVAGLSLQGHRVDRFLYYLDRHIELDGEHHGPMARQLVAALCADDRERWREAADTADTALASRIRLWDAVLEKASML